MREVDRIAEELRRAQEGDAWHGASLEELLEGVEAAGAAAKPIPGAHSIWEIVLHLTGWIREVSRRLQGETPALPPDGDWPEIEDPSAEAWLKARLELRRATEGLRTAVQSFSEDRLDAVVGETRDEALGVGVSWHQMLHGVSQHNAYHAGQIALLKKGMDPQTEAAHHRRYAAGLFNRTWELLDKPERSPEEALEMVHAAHASRFHWGQVGTPLHFARGEWQIARVYAVLGRAEPALRHATLSLELCQRHGFGDFDLAFAHEAMARAYAVGGDREERDRHFELAREAGRKIQADDDRKVFEQELATVP